MRLILCVALSAFVSACGSSGGVEVLVDLKTDLVPGLEFSAVVIELAQPSAGSGSGAPLLEIVSQVRSRVSSESDFVAGTRVGRFEGVATGTHWVIVRLLDDADRVVVQRPTVIEVVKPRLGVTVIATRDCRGIMCPSPGGGPELLACLAGQCVDPRCRPQAPEFCPPPECTSDDDCGRGAECAPPLCSEEGICLLGARSDLCAAEEFCVPDLGCLPVPTMADGGMPADGGLICGTICFVPERPCFAGYVDCSTGAPVCSDLFQVVQGTSCGADMVCDALGACVATMPPVCTPGGRCWTDCTEGTVECAGDVRSCALGAAMVTAGTACEPGLTCYETDGCGGLATCDAGGTCASNGPIRISVGPGGVEGDGASNSPALSADGNFVLFESRATNLVAGDTNGATDIFLRDLRTGIVERISVATDGSEGDDDADTGNGTISADGRFVAFRSDATNMVPGDTNAETDTFLRDRMMGTTERISVSTAGDEADSRSGPVHVTPDGRYVVFSARAGNLVPGDTNSWDDGFIRDRMLGTTERVTLETGGGQLGGGGGALHVSADGDSVVFSSSSATLGVFNFQFFSYVRSTMTTTLLSQTAPGVPISDNALAQWVSGDGRFVGFVTDASEVVPGDTEGVRDAFVLDRMTSTYTRLSVNAAGEGANQTVNAIKGSDDGTRWIFISSADNLVTPDTNGRTDVFLRDISTMTTFRVSDGTGGVEGDGSGTSSSVSADGRRVCFESSSTNLVADDTNAFDDIYCVLVP